jgi:hypothetical protein
LNLDVKFLLKFVEVLVRGVEYIDNSDISTHFCDCKSEGEAQASSAACDDYGTALERNQVIH